MLWWRNERSFKHQSLNYTAIYNRKMGPKIGSNVRLKHRFKRKAPSLSIAGMVPGGAYRNRVFSLYMDYNVVSLGQPEIKGAVFNQDKICENTSLIFNTSQLLSSRDVHGQWQTWSSSSTPRTSPQGQSLT